MTISDEPRSTGAVRLHEIAAGLTAIGLVTRLHWTRAGTDLTATLHPPGHREIEVILDERHEALARHAERPRPDVGAEQVVVLEVHVDRTAEAVAAEAATPATPNGAGKVECVHGSPLDEDEYIIVMHDAMEPLTVTNAVVTFFGHTHIQGGFCTHGEEWETLRPMYRSKKDMESCDLAVMPGAKYLINPGSAGQPRDGDWRAACAIYDSEQSRVTFYRVPYEVEKAQKAIISAKLPERLATRLNEGR